MNSQLRATLTYNFCCVFFSCSSMYWILSSCRWCVCTWWWPFNRWTFHELVFVVAANNNEAWIAYKAPSFHFWFNVSGKAQKLEWDKNYIKRLVTNNILKSYTDWYNTVTFKQCDSMKQQQSLHYIYFKYPHKLEKSITNFWCVNIHTQMQEKVDITMKI